MKAMTLAVSLPLLSAILGVLFVFIVELVRIFLSGAGLQYREVTGWWVADLHEGDVHKRWYHYGIGASLASAVGLALCLDLLIGASYIGVSSGIFVFLSLLILLLYYGILIFWTAICTCVDSDRLLARVFSRGLILAQLLPLGFAAAGLLILFPWKQ